MLCGCLAFSILQFVRISGTALVIGESQGCEEQVGEIIYNEVPGGACGGVWVMTPL